MKLKAAFVLAVCLSQPLNAQESLADQKTRLEIEQLQQQVRAAELEALSTLRSINGSTATVSDSEATAEALQLKYETYRAAFEFLATEIAPGSGGKVHVVFGETPPSLTPWFVHDENSKSTARALHVALRSWKLASIADLRNDEPYKSGSLAAVAAVASTVVALLRTDTSVDGASLDPKETILRSMLIEELANKSLVAEIDDFLLSRRGAEDLKYLLERDLDFQAVTPPQGRERIRGSVQSLYEQALTSYEEYLAEKPGIEARLKTATDATDTTVLRSQLSAGDNLEKAIQLYDRLKDSLLASTNGIVNATRIRRLEALADPQQKQHFLYILGHEAALTALTRKGAFLGLRSIPATFRAGLRLEYLFVTSERTINDAKRGSVFCLTDRFTIGQIPRTKGLSKGFCRSTPKDLLPPQG